MYTSLLALFTTALLCAALGWVPRWAAGARVVAPLGMAVALVRAVWREGFEGGGIAGSALGWPQVVSWLGEPIFRSDALSAGLGAWCLVLGGLCVLKMAVEGASPWRLALSVLTVGTLYSLVHTDNLPVFAGQVLGLLLLVWVYRSWGNEDISDENAPGYGRQLFAMGVGAAMLPGAVMLLGRTMGGDYSLVRMSLSALTVWPLVLITAFVVAWLGLLPFTGWSGESHTGGHSALVQALVLGVPVVTLLLRFEALLSAQALAGTLPEGWRAFTVTLSWLGALTALVSAAGMLVWAGTGRWTGLLTAHTLSLALWGLGLDTPQGRFAAVAILLAYGAGRITLELSRAGGLAPQGGIATASLGAVPLMAGFVGVWLLGAALAETGRATHSIVLAGTVVLAACGIALNAALSSGATPKPARDNEYMGWLGVAAACTLIIGGTIPGLWLPLVEKIVSIAGGSVGVASDWTGLSAGSGLSVPLLLALASIIVLSGLGWLVVAVTRSKVRSSGTLLPPALEYLAETRQTETATGSTTEGDPFRPLLTNVPAAAWWLSLAWLEGGITRIGSLLGRLGTRSGRLLGRLEGRFYLPLALILALLLVLAVTR